jgi:hypothetical protein
MDKEIMKKHIMNYFEETRNINSYHSNRLKNDLEETILFNDKKNCYINENDFIECMIELGFKYKTNGKQYKFNCKNRILKCEICDVKYKCEKVNIYKHQQNIKHKEFLKKL